MTRSIHRVSAITALLLVGALTSGCIYSHELASTRRALEDEMPGAQLDREVVLSLGPFSLWTLGWAASFVDGKRNEVRLFRRYLSDLHRVKVGVYKLRQADKASFAAPSQLTRLETQGWKVAVKVREEDERIWILYRKRDCFICEYYPRSIVRDLYVLVLDRDELVQVRLRGDFDRLLRRLLTDQEAFGNLAKINARISR